MRTVLLYGNDNPEDLEILRQRLDLFAGKGNYELTEEDGYLSLRLPASLFRNDGYLSECLEELLTGTGRLNFSDEDSGDLDFLRGTFTLARVQEDTLHDIEVQHLYIPDEVQAEEDLPFLSTDLPPARQLTFKVDEETASRIEEALKRGRSLSLSDNNIYDDYPTAKCLGYRWPVTASPDDAGSVFIDCDESEILYEHESLFTYNLTHPKLSRPFNYCIADDVIWEDPAESTSSGAGQCPVDTVCKDPDEPWVFFQASPVQLIANNNREGARRLLLQRLDLTGLPYALGQTGKGAFCVKIGASRISATIPELLLDSARRMSLNLYIPGCSNLISTSYARMEYDKKNAALKMYLSEESVSELRAAIKDRGTLLQENSAERRTAAAGEQTIPVYLRKDTFPLAVCSLDPAFSGRTLTFEDCILPDNGDDHSWFAALIQNIINSYDPSVPLLMLDCMYLSEGGHRSFDSSDLPVREHPLCSIEAITGKIRKILPGATVSLSPNMLRLEVHMNLPADGELIRKTFSLAPKILEACSLSSEYFDSVLIRPLEPVDDERCWLSFRRDQYDSISFSGYMYNGRLDAYAEELAKAVRKDTFFRSMISTKYSGWFYRSAP